MSKVTITFDEANELLDRAVAERGEDYVYEKPDGETNCLYFHDDGEPGCIVGLVLSYKGVTELGPGFNHLSADGLHRDGGYDADKKTLFLLSSVQGAQDLGTPWGRAVEAGRQDVEDVWPGTFGKAE